MSLALVMQSTRNYTLLYTGLGISLADGGDKLLLTVQNTGLPFPDLRSKSTGIGLRIMNYRANLIGASIEIKAAGRKGTVVTCSLPYEKR